MSKTILITGGSGFIGRFLVNNWLSAGNQVVVFTRRPGWVRQHWGGRVDAVSSLDSCHQRFDWLVNLAGEGIAEGRWSPRRKRLLRESRIDLTAELAAWATASGQQFELVMSGSAVGIYGAYSGKESAPLDEESSEGRDFAAQLCHDWEAAADAFQPLCQRLIILRTGLVFGANGGMLGRLWLPFKLGLGGVIGCGRQMLSWIHIQDYCRAVQYLAEHPCTGIVNMTAPQPVTNRRFTEVLASVLHRPACLPMPAPVARMIFGEMSDLLLKGQEVLPGRLEEMGFHFDYADVNNALADIKNSWK